MGNITSTNSVFKLSVPSLGINATLEGYAADTAFTTDIVEVTENRIGVDGQKSAGYLPVLYDQTVSLQADSNSIQIFDIIYAEMVLTRNAVFLEGVIELPGVSRVYTLTNGTLRNYKPIADVERVLEPIQFQINWGNIVVLPT